ncbi:hypothetical protein A2U01_0117150, partial [Trifolium medium]|nr:hypothetical protein [Trifolium medium]
GSPHSTYNHYLGGDVAEVLETARIGQGDLDGGDGCQKSRWNGQQQWLEVMKTDEKQCQNESWK